MHDSMVSVYSTVVANQVIHCLTVAPLELLIVQINMTIVRNCNFEVSK